jgi:hypothetical protein
MTSSDLPFISLAEESLSTVNRALTTIINRQSNFPRIGLEIVALQTKMREQHLRIERARREGRALMREIQAYEISNSHFAPQPS